MKRWILFGIVAAVFGRYAEDVPGMVAGVLEGLEGALGQMPAWQFDWLPLRLVGALALLSLAVPGVLLYRVAAPRFEDDDGLPQICKIGGYVLTHGGVLGGLAVLAGGFHAFQQVTV